MPALAIAPAPSPSSAILDSNSLAAHTAVRESEETNAEASVEAETVAKSDADADTDMCQPEPTTSHSSLFQLVSQPLLEAKDRRAYEVARQRVKRPQDRQKTRIQKAKLGRGLFAGTRDGRTVFRRVDDRNRDSEEESNVYGHGNPKMACDTGNANKSKPSSTPERPEVVVHLEDLIRAAKVRKTKAGDFEVIPHVRAVIALDDAEFGDNDDASKVPGSKVSVPVPEFVDGEDWEHVESESTTASSSSNEEEPSKAPSYAQVVSSAKQ